MKNNPIICKETECEYEENRDGFRENKIKLDIIKIDEALKSANETSLRDVHMHMDGKYSAYVPNWRQGMYGYVRDHGFNYNQLKSPFLNHNLNFMKSKLEGFAECYEKTKSKTYPPSNNINVNVQNNNNMTVSFEDAREKVDGMTSLTDQETQEILAKITELEEIISSSDKKKNKWEKAKSILIWLADKSFDVGMTLLPLLLNLNN